MLGLVKCYGVSYFCLKLVWTFGMFWERASERVHNLWNGRFVYKEKR